MSERHVEKEGKIRDGGQLMEPVFSFTLCGQLLLSAPTSSAALNQGAGARGF